jgi:hypothetical protein
VQHEIRPCEHPLLEIREKLRERAVGVLALDDDAPQCVPTPSVASALRGAP